MRITLPGAALAALLLHGAARAADCTLPAPVSGVAVEHFYADARGSVVDPARQAANQRATKAVRDFLYDVGRGADAALLKGDRTAGLCAAQRLENWARGGALQAPEANLEQIYSNTDYVLALGVEALKLQRAGIPLGAGLRGWLLGLAEHNVASFDTKAQHTNNLYDYTGAMSAVVAELAGNADLRRHAEQVLRIAEARIRPDGTAPAELARGQRAWIYHVRDFTAIAAMEITLRHCDAAPCLDAPARRMYDLITRRALGDTTLDRLAGTPQEEEGGTGWMIAVCAMARDDAFAASKYCKDAPAFYDILGGDWRGLMRAMSAGRV